MNHPHPHPHRIPNVPDMKKRLVSYDVQVPMFAFITFMSTAAGIVHFGRPYGAFCVTLACLCMAIFIAAVTPGLLDWWEKMTLVFLPLSLVVGFYYYHYRFGEEEDQDNVM